MSLCVFLLLLCAIVDLCITSENKLSIVSNYCDAVELQ